MVYGEHFAKLTPKSSKSFVFVQCGAQKILADASSYLYAIYQTRGRVFRPISKFTVKWVVKTRCSRVFLLYGIR